MAEVCFRIGDKMVAVAVFEATSVTVAVIRLTSRLTTLMFKDFKTTR